VRSYFDKELQVTESKSAEYEILLNNLGYVFLSDFHENYLTNEFPGILEYLKNTKGLIIDIRQKRGGSFQNIEAVVTRFMTVPMDKPKYYRLGEPVDLPQFQPRGPFTYVNPVVVLINGSTFSAGEWTTEILRQLPTVSVVGDTTGGGGVASSDASPETVGEYRLPSGKLVYIGTEYFERYDGRMIEWLGVPPDIRVVQTAEDVKQGRDKQLEFAISILK
jgi:C-terminal processing protease CtpA/Prc